MKILRFWAYDFDDVSGLSRHGLGLKFIVIHDRIAVSSDGVEYE